jgi:hypothetical protein
MNQLYLINAMLGQPIFENSREVFNIHQRSWVIHGNPIYKYIINKLALQLKLVQEDTSEYDNLLRLYSKFYYLMFDSSKVTQKNVYRQQGSKKLFPATKKIDRYANGIFQFFECVDDYLDVKDIYRLFRKLIEQKRYADLTELFNYHNGFFERFIQMIIEQPNILDDHVDCLNFLCSYRPEYIERKMANRPMNVRPIHGRIVDGYIKIPWSQIIACPLAVFDYYFDKKIFSTAMTFYDTLYSFVGYEPTPVLIEKFIHICLSTDHKYPLTASSIFKIGHIFSSSHRILLYILMEIRIATVNQTLDQLNVKQLISICNEPRVNMDNDDLRPFTPNPDILHPIEQEHLSEWYCDRQFKSEFFGRYYPYINIHARNLLNLLTISNLTDGQKCKYQQMVLDTKVSEFEQAKQLAINQGNNPRHILFCYNCGLLSNKESQANGDWTFCKCCNKTYCSYNCINYPEYLKKHNNYLGNPLRIYTTIDWSQFDMNQIYPYYLLADNSSIVQSISESKQIIKSNDSKCNYCSSTGKLLRCTKCHSARYCNTLCQKYDWPIHKMVCQQSK